MKHSDLSESKDKTLHLRTQSDWKRFGADDSKKFKRCDRSLISETEKKMGSTFIDFEVKPKILESKICGRDEFFNLSNGFK